MVLLTRGKILLVRFRHKNFVTKAMLSPETCVPSARLRMRGASHRANVKTRFTFREVKHF